jgi:hypothetical protein
VEAVKRLQAETAAELDALLPSREIHLGDANEDGSASAMKMVLSCCVLVILMKGALVCAAPLCASAGTDYQKMVRENIEEQRQIHDLQFYSGIVFLIFQTLIGFGIVIGVYLWLRRDAEHKRQVLDSLQREHDRPSTVASSPRACENCSRTIGNLEKVYTFENHIVCAECFSRLKSQTSQGTV